MSLLFGIDPGGPLKGRVAAPCRAGLLPINKIKKLMFAQLLSFLFQDNVGISSRYYLPEPLHFLSITIGRSKNLGQALSPVDVVQSRDKLKSPPMIWKIEG
jgi:hypothetical protein